LEYLSPAPTSKGENHEIQTRLTRVPNCHIASICIGYPDAHRR
jgi:hypothetical protein